MKTSSLNVRGLNYHVQEWGETSNPTVFLLHGWMDCGASYKFVAEHLSHKYHLVAPDLRGFGETDHASGYWFPDYFADIDRLFDYYSPDQKVDLVGHSMGGNIALMYAGIRPDRIANVLSMEALGMAPTESTDAPLKYRRWMSEILSDEPSKVYLDEESFRRSIRKGNPSLNEALVSELVKLWGKPHGNDGALQLKHDHAHRYANPVRYNFDDVLAVWQEITGRVGVVMAEQSSMYKYTQKMGRLEQAREVLNVSEQDYFLVKESAHMLHLEQPVETAKCIESFFSI